MADNERTVLGKAELQVNVNGNMALVFIVGKDNCRTSIWLVQIYLRSE